MGNFFSNVQVHAGDTPQKVHQALIAALRAELGAAGFQEAGAKERAERTIVVGPVGAWIAVYDEDEDQLDARAAMLSKATKRHAVSVKVHDDDVIWLRLYGGGTTLDRWCNAPDYFERVSKAERAEVAGKPAAWSKVIARGGTKALAAAWRKRPTFASEHVENLATVLGWHPTLARLGPRYLDDDATDGLTWIRFKRGRGKLQTARGETTLCVASVPPSVDGVVGKRFELPLVVRNEGGPGKGVNVWLHGPALDESVLEITAVSSGKTSKKPDLFTKAKGIPREVLEQAEPSELFVRFPDIPLAAGVVEPPNPEAYGTELVERRRRAEVSLRIQGRFTKAGDTQLGVGVAAGGWPITQDGKWVRISIAGKTRSRAP